MNKSQAFAIKNFKPVSLLVIVIVTIMVMVMVMVMVMAMVMFAGLSESSKVVFFFNNV